MNSNDFLEDFSSQKFKSRLHVPLLILLAAYLGYFLFDFFIDIQTFEIKTGRKDWSVFVFLFLLPLTATVFFILHKKAGWWMSCIYFWFLTLIISAALIKNIIDDRFYFSWYSSFITLIVFTISVLLVFKTTRKHFRIGMWMCIISLLLAAIFSCIFISYVFSL